VETARSIITTLTVFSGIALIPIMFPLVESRSGPIGRGGDIRPTLLAIAMLGLYAAIVQVPFARDFFELEPLPLGTVIPLLLYVLAWMLAIIVLLRLDVPGRVARWATGRIRSRR
jgi:cation-transporting ATPase E